MDELGITSSDYQQWAAHCVGTFLANFEPSPKNRMRAVSEETSAVTPYRIRVLENPPSVQVVQMPQGGVEAGRKRIQEKIAGPSEIILTAEEKDLTRECIILTLHDALIESILKSGLLLPGEAAKILDELRKDRPKFFVVVQRYLMGIESDAGIKIPYSIVEKTDIRTMEYLEQLPSHLS
ncbi:MAG: hypothetical protein AAB588_06450 [Patescibacteria group bacterium]